MQHVHYSSSSTIIHAATQAIVEAYASRGANNSTVIGVCGVNPKETKVGVTDRVVSVAAREVYFRSLQVDDSEQESAIQCQGCRQYFLNQIRGNRLEIALRVMEALRQKGLISSCESVDYNQYTKEIKASFRQTASLPTQEILPIPPIYLGSYEEVCEVEQRQYAISSASSPKPVLATWHFSDCVAAVGFDKEQKIGFLFHIDADSRIARAITNLVSSLQQRDGNANYSFEYILLGSADRKNITAEDRRVFIQNLFEKNSSNTISFKRRSQDERDSISFNDFMKDSFWSRSVRLCRSVAIDLRHDDPLSSLMGYEAELNPYSAFHKRERTDEEADLFCLTASPQMKCVYKVE